MEATSEARKNSVIERRLLPSWAIFVVDRSAVWAYECAFRRGVNTRPINYDDRYTPIRRYGFVADVEMPEPRSVFLAGSGMTRPWEWLGA